MRTTFDIITLTSESSLRQQLRHSQGVPRDIFHGDPHGIPRSIPAGVSRDIHQSVTRGFVSY